MVAQQVFVGCQWLSSYSPVYCMSCSLLDCQLAIPCKVKFMQGGSWDGPKTAWHIAFYIEYQLPVIEELNLIVKWDVTDFLVTWFGGHQTNRWPWTIVCVKSSGLQSYFVQVKYEFRSHRHFKPKFSHWKRHNPGLPEKISLNSQSP